MDLYLSMLAGVLLYILGKLNPAFQLPDFSWPTFWKRNLIPVLISIVSGWILVYGRQDIGEFLKMIPGSPQVTFGRIMTAICGVGGTLIFKFLADIFTPGKKTTLGIN